MRAAKLFGMGLILSSLVFTSVQAETPDPRSITVQGVAELNVPADRITFFLDMVVLLPVEADCRDRLSSLIEEQRQFALSVGAMEKKTRVSSLKIAPIYKSWKRQDRGVRTYKGEGRLKIEFDDPVLASSWFTSIKSDGTMEVQGPSFYHSDIPTLKKRVLKLAVGAAMEKADLLLGEVRESRAEVLEMHVVGENDALGGSGSRSRSYGAYANSATFEELDLSPGGEDLVIQPKLIELTLRVQITFALVEGGIAPQ